MAKVLIVDDDARMGSALKTVLEDTGHRVVFTTTGRNVSALMIEQEFDLVISDIFMPNDRDGIEVIRELRQTNPEVGIIAMSGASLPQRGLYLNAAEVLGVDATLEKPFSMNTLFATVDGVLKHAALRKRDD